MVIRVRLLDSSRDPVAKWLHDSVMEPVDKFLRGSKTAQAVAEWLPTIMMVAIFLGYLAILVWGPGSAPVEPNPFEP